MPRRIKKEDIMVEYVYAEPKTEAERVDAESQLNRAFDIIFNHMREEYKKKKQSEKNN